MFRSLLAIVAGSELNAEIGHPVSKNSTPTGYQKYAEEDHYQRVQVDKGLLVAIQEFHVAEKIVEEQSENKKGRTQSH